MLSSWRMYEMHLALFLKAGCDTRLGGGPCLAQYAPQGTPQTPHIRQAAPTSTLARPTGQKTGPTCFKCSQIGHYANACPVGNSSASAQMVQTLLSVCFTLMQFQQHYYLILELRIRLFLLDLQPPMNYHCKT
jgi:hypothetical protein